MMIALCLIVRHRRFISPVTAKGVIHVSQRHEARRDGNGPCLPAPADSRCRPHFSWWFKAISLAHERNGILIPSWTSASSIAAWLELPRLQ